MTSSSKKNPYFLLGSLVIIGCVFLVYVPMLTAGRVWDDFFLIGENPLFKSPVFVLEVFHHFLWMDQIAAYYRPVQNLSFMGDYWLWGEWFGGYHLTSILLHALGGVLFWRLVVRLLGDAGVDGKVGRFSVVELAGFLTALIWVVHPAHNAAVAYISGRADPLASFFALAGWLVFRGGLRPVGIWVAVSLGLWLLALCSRETGMLWLALFVIYEGVWRQGMGRSYRILAGASGVLLFAVYAFLRRLPGEPVDRVGSAQANWVEGVLDTLRAFGDYIMLFVAPFYLSMERALVAEGEFGGGLFVAAALGVGFLIVLAVFPGKTRRLRRLVVLWFTLGFIAISPLVVTNAKVAEHWMVFPFAGLALGFVSLLLDLSPRRRWIWGLVGCWVVLLGARTIVRCGDWKDQATFLRHTFAHGEKSDRITGVLASEALKRGDIDQAEAMLREAITDSDAPALLEVYLASILLEQGKLEEALALVSMSDTEMEDASRLHPVFSGIPLTRARVLAEMDQKDEAVEVLTRALGIWPNHWGLMKVAYQMLQQAGRGDEARERLEGFVDSHSWLMEANVVLAVDRYQQGEVAEARELLRKASCQDIRSPVALRILAALEAQSGDVRAARRVQLRALARSGGADEDKKALAAIEAAGSNRSERN